jgi:hypothetical protein
MTSFTAFRPFGGMDNNAYLPTSSPNKVQHAISYKDFDVSNIVDEQSRTQTSASATISYHEYPIRYKYPDGTIASLAILGPRVLAENGLRPPGQKLVAGYDADPKKAPPKSSIGIPLLGESGKQMEKVFDEIQTVAATRLCRDKAKLGKLGRGCVDVEAALRTLHDIYWYPKDTATGERDHTRPAVSFSNIVEFDGLPKTAFIRPTGEGANIAPLRLCDVRERAISLLPTWIFKRLFVGSAVATVQFFVDSVLVCDIPTTITAPVHDAAIAALVRENADAIARMNKLQSPSPTIQQPTPPTNTADDVPEWTGIETTEEDFPSPTHILDSALPTPATTARKIRRFVPTEEES